MNAGDIGTDTVLMKHKPAYGNITGKGRVFMRRIMLAVTCALSLSAAYAAGAATAERPPATRTETDPKTGALLFIINGKEQARIDATGLHVREDVAYGGTLTDYG